MSNRQYVGARYVPMFADPAQWDSTRSYEPLTIVTNLGNSYTSRKPVPAGTPLNNTSYWVLTGNFNSQLQTVLNKIANIKQSFNNVSALRSAEDLTAGDVVETFGYRTPGDGGGAMYIITDLIPDAPYITVGNKYAVLVNNGIITPEMFGAYGDDDHDDTSSIQAAIDTDEFVTFLQKTYKTTYPVEIHNKNNWIMDAENAVIDYTGNNYAFYINASRNIRMKFNVINAVNGGCLYLHSHNVEDYVQYINIEFLQFRSLTNCIYGYVTNTGWVNEIRVHNGRFIAGANGCYLFKDGAVDTMNHWNFYNVGIEGVTTGFYFNNASTSRIADMTFVGCRYNESYETLIKTVGLCQFFTFIGSGMINSNALDISSQSDLWTFICPTLSHQPFAVVKSGVFETCGYPILTDGGIEIKANDDLNDFTSPGNAHCSTSAAAAAVVNSPTTSAFRLMTISCAGLYESGSQYAYLTQIVIPTTANIMYMRAVQKNAGTWVYGSWSRFVNTDSMSEIIPVNVGTDAIFRYRYNNHIVEFWIDTNSSAFASQTDIVTLPLAIRPKFNTHVALTAWSNAAVTDSGRNALRINTAGVVSIIAPDTYRFGHGVYSID